MRKATLNKKCKNCGIEYMVFNSLRKFCGKKCFDDFRRGKKLDKAQIISQKERNRRKRVMRQRWDENREGVIEKIKISMGSPEMKAILSALNSRKRSPMTLAVRIKHSRALEGKFPANYYDNARANKWSSKFDWIEFGERKFYMRSGWERNIARYFEWLKERGEIKDWDYEPKRFIFEKIQFGNRTYLPDFKIIENNGKSYWVEVKGYWTQGARTKIKRFMKYFPEEKIQIIDGEQYAQMKGQLKNLIPEWE